VRPDTTRRSSDCSILVMESLAEWPKHGFALIKDIEGFAGVKLGPGSLYGALARLEAAGLVEPLRTTEDVRRPYRITSAGRSLLESVRGTADGSRYETAASA
jgi:DNA-binding PadR family transcriptional regulator